jgi:hypothetical protein
MNLPTLKPAVLQPEDDCPAAEAVISCWPSSHLLFYNSARIYPHSHSVQVYGHHTQSRFTIIAFIQDTQIISVWHGNVFTKPLPSKRRLLWVHYPGSQAPCRIAPPLRLLVPTSLRVYRNFCCSRGRGGCLWHLWLASPIASQHHIGLDASFFRFRLRPAFTLRRFGLVLLSSSCSLF